MTVYVLHENPDWYPPFARAFEDAGVDAREWLLIEGTIDLDSTPPEGIFYNRLSASSHTRGHIWTKDYTRALLEWLEANGRRVVNGRSVVEMEVSKVRQYSLLKQFGIETPRTVAVIGTSDLLETARAFPTPFITKHNQGGKGLGVRRCDRLDDLQQYIESEDFEQPADGITLLQEYLQPREPFITRIETVGYEYVYAITADTTRGGFQLCPADACGLDEFGKPKTARSLFDLRAGFYDPLIDQVTAFAREHRL